MLNHQHSLTKGMSNKKQIFGDTSYLIHNQKLKEPEICPRKLEYQQSKAHNQVVEPEICHLSNTKEVNDRQHNACFLDQQSTMNDDERGYFLHRGTYQKQTLNLYLE